MADRSVALLFAVCLVCVLAPVALLTYPPLLDYPNHLARLFILTHPEDPQLAEFYRVEWSLLPNLGFDLIAYALAQAMPVEVAGRIFLGIAFAVVLSAPMALHRALYGRLSPLPLVAGALLFNLVLQMGFLAYFLGVGLAVWGFALWLMCRRAGAAVRFAVLQVMALATFICHLSAVAVLGVLVAMSAASEGWRNAEGTFGRRVKRAAAAAAPEVLPFVLPFVLLLASETGGAGDGIAFQDPVIKLLIVPVSLMLAGTLPGLGLLLAVLVPTLVLRLGRTRIIHPAAVWPAAALLLLYPVMPHKLMSSENADWRLLIPAAFVLIGAASEPFRSSRGTLAIAVFALAVNAAAAYGAWTQWRDGDDIFAELQAALEPLPEGALLVPYLPGEEELRNAYLPPSLLHAATHAVRERKALVPTIFATHGQQPIRVTDPYKATREWSALLRAGEPLPQGAERAVDAGTYVLGIRTDYDVTRPVPSLPVPADRLVRTQHFTLYRLKASTAAPDQVGGGG